MSFVLRFADKDGEIRGEFLGFLHCELGLPWEGSDETGPTEIGNLTLELNNCRGQGYDGEASIFSHIKVLLHIYLELIRNLYTLIVTVTN